MIKVTFATPAAFVLSPTRQLRTYPLSSKKPSSGIKAKQKEQEHKGCLYCQTAAHQNKQTNIIVTNKIQGNTL